MDRNKNGTRTSRWQKIVLLAIVVIVITVAGLFLVTISSYSAPPPSNLFVDLPTTPLSTRGDKVSFVQVSAIIKATIPVGIEGYLKNATGSPVAGATVYLSYYYMAYRNQSAITDKDGYFQFSLPMNWTGWLPCTLIYFGSADHRGIRQICSVEGA